jgi:DNA mismatch repair ATPase MutL
MEEKTEPQIVEETPAPSIVAEEKVEEYNPEKEVRLIGEAFSTYIVAEMGESVFLIDKHAAHERILFNEFKETQQIEMQNLLSAVSVRLEAEEYTAVLSNIDLLLKAGFEIEDFGDGTVLVNDKVISKYHAKRGVGKRVWGKGHSALIRDFYNCLKTGEKFALDFFEAEKSVKMILAMYKSNGEEIKI